MAQSSPRERLGRLLERRYRDMGQPSLIQQNAYRALLSTIQLEKKLVAIELLDLMLDEVNQSLSAQDVASGPRQAAS